MSTGKESNTISEDSTNRRYSNAAVASCLAPGTGSPQASKTRLEKAIKSRLHPIELALIFIAALALRCIFNFVFEHVNNFGSCDAFEYIQNGQALLTLFTQPSDFWHKCLSCLSGTANPADWHAVKTALLPLKDFYISGPVFPAVLALITAIMGGATANVHFLWQPLLLGNCIASSLTCVFIALMANEAYEKRTARIAALISIVYPGFIVNSGRLYSETFATFLLVALSYLTVRGFRSNREDRTDAGWKSAPAGGNSFPIIFLSGFLAAALQLTRSVLFFLTLALIPINFIQQKGKRKFTFLIPFALGFALVAVPWLAFQKLAFGGGGLVVDRVGHYNFFIGNNVDTQGWLTYPYPDGRNVEAKTFPDLLKTAVDKSPARWVRLMLDKPLRLFKFPWNDFRTAIGPLNYRMQVVIHELILLLACLGFALGIFVSFKRPPGRPETFCRTYLAGLLLFHCIYYLFITVPRYNLCAMPEMIIFAAAGCAAVIETLRERSRKLNGIILAGSAAAFFAILQTNFMPFFIYFGIATDAAWAIEAAIRVLALAGVLASTILVCNSMQGRKRLAISCAVITSICMLPLLVLPLRANGRYIEWHQDLSLSSAPAKQTLQIPRELCAPGTSDLILLIDTQGVRQTADGLNVSVNGHHLPGPVMPSMSFAENFDRFLALSPGNVQREGERMWDSLTNSAGCANLDLRQWSMIVIPKDLLAAVADEKTSSSNFVTLNVSIANHSTKPLRIFGSYAQKNKERILPSVDLYSWEKVFYGVENPEGLTDTRYDIKAPATTVLESKKDLSDQPGMQNGHFNLAILRAPPNVVQGNRPSTLLSSSHIGTVFVDAPEGARVHIDVLNLPRNQDSIWLFRLTGRCKVFSGNACPAADVSAEYRGNNGTPLIYESAWSPHKLNKSNEWNEFEFVIPVKPIVENAEAHQAIVSFRTVSPDSPYTNIQHPFAGDIQFAGVKLDIYELPANPIGLGHRVY